MIKLWLERKNPERPEKRFFVLHTGSRQTKGAFSDYREHSASGRAFHD